MNDQLISVLTEIEKNQKEDPNTLKVGDEMIPKEFLYGQRMMEMLAEYNPTPSETLSIAAKGQHIRRWEIPRNSYSMDRKGYLQWRTQEKLAHGKLLGSIMKEIGYEIEAIEKVNDLVTKKRLKNDPETQELEDVICLVFLKYYFGDFALEHPREKIISILQKTWGKMTEKGHDMALQLPLGKAEVALIQEALA